MSFDCVINTGVDQVKDVKQSDECIEPLDVIIDTDIGTDVDDAYALLFSLSSPELRVRGVTLVHGNLDTRSKITFKILKLLRRLDVPVAKGWENPLNDARSVCWSGHEGVGIDFSDITDCSTLSEDAANFIARVAEENSGKLVLITIGPMTNAAVAIQRFPDLKRHLKGIVAMASVFNGFGRDRAGVEHNIAVDPEAAKVVLESGIPLYLVGLNVTLKTSLTREHLEKIRSADTNLSRLFAHMTEQWLAVCKREYAIMHDPLAVAAAFDQNVVRFIPVRPDVSLDTAGIVSYYPGDDDSRVMIADRVNVEQFNLVFFPRIMSAICHKKGCSDGLCA